MGACEGVDNPCLRPCEGIVRSIMQGDDVGIRGQINRDDIFVFAGFHIDPGDFFDPFCVCIQGHYVLSERIY